MESCGFGGFRVCLWKRNMRSKTQNNKKQREFGDRWGEKIRHDMYLDPDLSDVPSVFRALTYVSQ